MCASRLSTLAAILVQWFDRNGPTWEKNEVVCRREAALCVVILQITKKGGRARATLARRFPQELVDADVHTRACVIGAIVS